jgi:antitoxin (DNA-binding transcriptional repressor) of toxin-antitoxin stability system
MQVKTVEISQLPPAVTELLALLTNGDEVVLASEGKAIARLVPAVSEKSETPRVMGLFEGQGWMSDDFNEPLPDEFWGGRV